MEWAACGRGAIPIPGGIYELCECGTKGSGLVIGFGRSDWWLDLVILKVFSDQDDSMIGEVGTFCKKLQKP